MDLLGDIGNHDQLVSTRAENAILSQKVKELSVEVKALQLENASLKAEVELYRSQALSNDEFTRANKDSSHGNKTENDEDGYDSQHFVRSGNGNYVSDPAVTLQHPSGQSNPVCCSMNDKDTLLAIGSADSRLGVFSWGSALAPPSSGLDPSKEVVDKGVLGGLQLPAPVISTCFSFFGNFLAAGCMDGSVHVVSYGLGNNATALSQVELDSSTGSRAIKHTKYVKCLEWSPSAPILASASADGVIVLTKVVLTQSSNEEEFSMKTISLETQETFHLDGTVEAMCFLDNGNTLCCYVRGTPHLSYFHLNDSCKIVKYSLNGEVTGGFDSHVSFSVMSLSPSPGNQGKYLVAATDSSRNIILQSHSSKQIRNLYGHKNDGFSQPKVAWSKNGQYIYGNTQEENCVCVWDCASSSIVKKLDDTMGGHTGQLRDFYSSSNSDTLATISYDKTAKIWLPAL